MGIKSFLGLENTLYYPGCLLKGVLKGEFENYKKIFNKLGIDFVLLSEKENCCGLPVLNGGYKKDARKLAEKNLKLFKEKKITKIITSCPSCYHTFKHIYPELLTGKHIWDIEVEHATVSILKALKRKGWRFDGDKEIVTYHDPCHLGRYGKEKNDSIYDEPREVMEILGGMIKEMKHNRDEALCCGGGGGVRANFPSTAKKIAGLRVKDMPKDAEKIISPCGLCFANLSSAFPDDKQKSEEFSSFVLRKLKEMGK